MLKKAEMYRDAMNLGDSTENSATTLDNTEDITTNLDNSIENITEIDTTNLESTAESDAANFDITTESATTKSDSSAESDEANYIEKFLIFTILGKLYSLPSKFIGEIALFDTVYPLPLMPAYVPGVVNRYSVPYALFDIGLLFYSTPSPRKKVLVMKDEIDRIAFLIDDVAGIADIPQEELFNLERSSDMSNSVGLGDITDAVESSFSWNGSDVLVLDIHRILARAGGDTV